MPPEEMGTDEVAQPTGYLVDPAAAPTLHVLGPTIQYLTPPDGDDAQPCVMRGTMPPGVVVPLHSHADPETFVMLSGRVEGLVVSAAGFSWAPVVPGDVFHVPGHARHAWRNPGPEPAVMLIISTSRIGRFFAEVAEPAGDASWPPSEQAIRRLLAVAERYGYWNATPEENAGVGLRL